MNPVSLASVTGRKGASDAKMSRAARESRSSGLPKFEVLFSQPSANIR